MEKQDKTYTLMKASKLLHCCERTVVRRIQDGSLKATKIKGDYLITRSEINRYIKEYGTESQLCESCENACGGCRWSDELLPVEGWNVEPTKVYIDKRKPIDSFHVKSCPMYKPDKTHNIQSLTDEAFYRLIYAMLFALVRDYANSCKKLYVDRENSALAYKKLKEIQSYVKTPMFDEMLGVLQFNTDGEQLLEMIRADPLGVLQRIGHIEERTNRKEKTYNDYQND